MPQNSSITCLKTSCSRAPPKICSNSLFLWLLQSLRSLTRLQLMATSSTRQGTWSIPSSAGRRRSAASQSVQRLRSVATSASSSTARPSTSSTTLEATIGVDRITVTEQMATETDQDQARDAIRRKIDPIRKELGFVATDVRAHNQQVARPAATSD